MTTKGVAINVGKGWNDRGKMEFQQYTEMIIEKRKEVVWLEKRARTVKKLANKEQHNCKRRSYDDICIDNGEAMNKEAKDRWNEFMMNSIHNMNNSCQTAAL